MGNHKFKVHMELLRKDLDILILTLDLYYGVDFTLLIPELIIKKTGME
jgi:hypothetical protein